MITAQEAYKQSYNNGEIEQILNNIEKCIYVAISDKLFNCYYIAELQFNGQTEKAKLICSILRKHGYITEYQYHEQRTIKFEISWSHQDS